MMAEPFPDRVRLPLAFDAARNGGSAERVHLVIDAELNGWLPDLLEAR